MLCVNQIRPKNILRKQQIEPVENHMLMKNAYVNKHKNLNKLILLLWQ